ncbi:MAG: energy transducer TonB [Alistipes sp.]|nr:energy transducer TonB [Alistipes sp.]
MSDSRKHIPTNERKVQPRRLPRRANVDLGDTRSESAGEWLYSHRVGLLVVMVVFMLSSVVLATARYNVDIRPVEYIIEFVTEEPTVEDIERLKMERDRIQAEINQRLAAVQNVKNLQSNDASSEAGSMEQTSFDSDMQDMMDKVARDMATNRGDYESGVREAKGIGQGSGSGTNAGKGSGDRGKFSGAVTVAYDFRDPVRHHRDLYTPAYRAKSGGVVVVDVWLNRNGEVTAARIQSSTNAELNDQALNAARHKRTRFNIDSSAPTSHRGTITYTFVAQ